ncbi:MAG: hypothetical protein ABH805_01630 [Candidatus Nealsonbacteria bacterium]
MKNKFIVVILIIVVIVVLVILATIIGGGVMWYMANQKNDLKLKNDLEVFKQEAALGLIYPQSIRLHHTETPRISLPLQGIKMGAQVKDFYGAYDSDEEIGAFYQEKLASLGWEFRGVSGSQALRYYKLLVFYKDEVSFEIQFWSKENFEYGSSLPINYKGRNTIYAILLLGPAE